MWDSPSIYNSQPWRDFRLPKTTQKQTIADLQSETLHYSNSHQLPVQGYVYGVKVSCFPDKEPKKVFVSKENNTKGRLDKVTHLKR